MRGRVPLGSIEFNETRHERLDESMKIQMNRSGTRSRTDDVSAPQTGMRKLMTALLVVALLGAPSIGFAGEAARETGREGGLGAAAALSSLVYGPVKLVYATGGLIVGAFAWAFTAGDTQVATKVFTRSLRGNYVVTPDHLTGERELVFIGRDVGQVAAGPAEAVAAAQTATAEKTDESDYDEMGW